MKKIATHNSSTGELAGTIGSVLLTPFARCQSKTLKEQFDAGCRLFDIRVKKVNGAWHCAHGPWITKRGAIDILSELNHFPECVAVDLTYEGSTKDVSIEEFIEFANNCEEAFKYIIWGGVAYKYGDKSKGIKVDYKYIKKASSTYRGGKQGFLPLDGHSWHTYIPIPWLWDRIYSRPHKFNEDKYTYVDFL